MHDLHVWTIGSGEVSFSSHVVAKAGAEPSALLASVLELLRGRFAIHHSTVQIETEPRESDPACEPAHGATLHP